MTPKSECPTNDYTTSFMVIVRIKTCELVDLTGLFTLSWNRKSSAGAKPYSLGGCVSWNGMVAAKTKLLVQFNFSVLNLQK